MIDSRIYLTGMIAVVFKLARHSVPSGLVNEVLEFAVVFVDRSNFDQAIT
jgi:hypothetical protein